MGTDAETMAPTYPQLSSWQDIDASLAEYCAARGLAPPPGIEESIDIHIRAMEEWLDIIDEKTDK